MAYIMRSPEDADVEGLLALLEERARELPGRPAETRDHLENLWRYPRFDRREHHRIASRDGVVVAEMRLWLVETWAHAAGYVSPTARGEGIGSALLAWARGTASAAGYRELRFTVDALQRDARALAESVGGKPLRTFYLMRHGAPAGVAPPRWPAGIRVVNSLRGEELFEAIAAAYDGSFVDHWSFEPIDRGFLRTWMDEPAFRPELCFFAYREEDLAGFSIGSLHGVHGEVTDLGTLRPYRGMGLGRALLNHCVRELARLGASEVVLGVDSENPTGALGLYERTGFTVAQQNLSYLIPLGVSDGRRDEG